jgi:hypothetical protein
VSHFALALGLIAACCNSPIALIAQDAEAMLALPITYDGAGG